MKRVAEQQLFQRANHDAALLFQPDIRAFGLADCNQTRKKVRREIAARRTPAAEERYSVFMGTAFDHPSPSREALKLACGVS
ncbi:MAG: hypothetical protein A3H28_16050 [Acidobacteria bacterium RIFCSPLOWO2_02_FULL_61_28]|nr:MAG: hypothetical protein A3H28_16050 [Acidobacteria bacterium RIFCSPLOWO2_02_FULL_61_28]